MEQQQASGVLRILQNALESQPEPHPVVAKFDQMIDQNFVEFSRKESGCDNLKAYIGLQRIKQRLQEIANFPEINSKTVIAVGGGFSAGKSSFINSLLDPDGSNMVQLATGNRPVTAVPSYLVHSSDPNEICGINYKNARFGIASSDYEELKHDSEQIGAIRVGSAIKYCTVKLKFRSDLLEQCCLIDIPGYNPGTNTQNKAQENSGSEIDTGDEVDLSFLDDSDTEQAIDELNISGIEEPSTDYNIARDAIAKADCLIWLFSLEHGPLPGNDLEFLKKLGFGHKSKPLFLIGNKADTRTVADAKACLAETCHTLSDAGIEYAGICAYNSRQGKVTLRMSKGTQDVFDFIRDHNHFKNIEMQLDNELSSIFSIYFEKISDEVYFSNNVLEQIEQIERQGILDGLFRPGRRPETQKLLDELKEEFYERRKEPADLKEAQKVRDKLSDCIHEFCSSLDLHNASVKNTKYCILCGSEIDVNSTSCQFCHAMQDGSGKLCPQCGTLVSFEAAFCHGCGFKF